MAVFEKRTDVKTIIDDSVTLYANIEAAQIIKDHVEYLIHVQRGSVPENSWNVVRRYSDFANLDAQLKISSLELNLPPKKYWGNLDRDFVAKRKQQLQKYLNTVMANPVLASCFPVRHFLDPSNYKAPLQEVALQDISMYFRSEPKWEIIEPLPDFGCRLKKQYFLIKNRDQPNKKYILSWSKFGGANFLNDKDLQHMMRLLPSFQHQNLFPVQFAQCTESSGIVIRPFHEPGTLRDMINKTKPKVHFLKKYGYVYERVGLHLPDIKHYGKQVLEVLIHLYSKGLFYGHLHSGNVIVQNGNIQLMDLENALFGLPSCYKQFFTAFRKIKTMEAVEVYCFGHLLYEMAFGERLHTPTCDSFHPDCPPVLRAALESILLNEACKNGLPSLKNLLLHPLFSEGSMSCGIKPQVKMPSKLREIVVAAKEKVEAQLQEEQKVFLQYERLKKATEFHMSEEEKKRRKRTKRRQQSTTADQDSVEPEPTNCDLQSNEVEAVSEPQLQSPPLETVVDEF